MREEMAGLPLGIAQKWLASKLQARGHRDKSLTSCRTHPKESRVHTKISLSKTYKNSKSNETSTQQLTCECSPVITVCQQCKYYSLQHSIWQMAICHGQGIEFKAGQSLQQFHLCQPVRACLQWEQLLDYGHSWAKKEQVDSEYLHRELPVTTSQVAYIQY